MGLLPHQCSCTDRGPIHFKGAPFYWDCRGHPSRWRVADVRKMTPEMGAAFLISMGQGAYSASERYYNIQDFLKYLDVLIHPWRTLYQKMGRWELMNIHPLMREEMGQDLFPLRGRKRANRHDYKRCWVKRFAGTAGM
jgi:hypothetical protein